MCIRDRSATKPVNSSSASNGKPAPKMDMSQYEGVAGNAPAGQAAVSGIAVPSTGIPDPSYVFFLSLIHI